MITGHGGDIQETAARLGCGITELIDMSSNLNPLGPLEGLEDFLRDNIKSIITLPDADTSRISKALADLYDLDSKNIVAGNGTTQFIYNLPLALKFRKVLILAPAYADYADACRMHGASVSYFMAETGNPFLWDFEKLKLQIRNYDAVYICNPNSPSGSIAEPSEIIGLAAENPGVWFVIDETYLPFACDWQKKSVSYNRLPNIVVLHSLSKIHRIPGLRTGFMVADKKVIKEFMGYFMPWSVNSLAQAAVMYLAGKKAEVKKFIAVSHEFIKNQQSLVIKGLKDCDVEFHDSVSVFMLGKTGLKAPDSGMLHRRMLERHIMIRDCSDFSGLSDRYFRISLHSQENNLKFVEALKECLN